MKKSPATIGGRLASDPSILMKITAFVGLCAPLFLPAASALAKPKSWVGLQVTTDAARYAPGQPITVRLLAHNDYFGPAYLKFTSGQRFDFQLFRVGSKDAAYTWSANKMFAQTTGQLKFSPTQSKEFEAQIGNEAGALPPGKYQLRAFLTSTSRIEAKPVSLEIVSSLVPLQTTTDKTQYKVGEPVRITLAARNTTGAARTLRFNSGQSFDVEVFNGGGEPVWNWAANKRFTMALHSVELKPGQTQTYEATWDGTALPDAPKMAPGTYTIRATLTSNPRMEAPALRVEIK